VVTLNDCPQPVAEQALAALLTRVQKPGRYCGGEWNSIARDWRSARVTLALAYPDTYEIGMSNLGLGILYDLVNQRADMLAERVYCPWEDMEAALRAAGLPLYSLETHRPLAAFDVIGFSLQHELNYTNMLTMLDLAGLPLLAAERDERHPLIIAGGSCTYNPEPLADFLDAAVIGEGEEVLLEVLECVAAHRATDSREALLRRLARIEGVYVPRFYQPRYASDGTLLEVAPTESAIPARVRKRILPRLWPVPTRPIVPTIETVHDRAMIEVQRGCSRGCRFCQAGMIYRPIRERPVAETLAALEEILANTGHHEVSLVSLSSSDHSGIAEIVAGVMARPQAAKVAVSLPSLRIDSFSVQLAQMIQSVRKTGFTFAPEAGSQRLRDSINKGVTEEDLLRTAEAIFAQGWNRVKLYFMLGLPGEEDEDALEMVRLIQTLRTLGRRVRGREVEISVSASTFVPKPHTPFQWAGLAAREGVEERQRLLRAGTRARSIAVSWSDWESTWLEALLSRGDRRLGRVIARAWRAGSRFEAWAECYQPALWHQALAEEGLDPAFYTHRPRGEDEVLPWEVIDVGVTRRFLRREYERSASGALSPDCRAQCHDCGVLAAFGAQRSQGEERAPWGCP
jgi:radical SAM family uncharacterized protein